MEVHDDEVYDVEVQRMNGGQNEPEADPHYAVVMNAMVNGRVIPFLGAGVNLCGRPEEETWAPGRYLPSGTELARILAENFDYPLAEATDLVRVSQYVAVMHGGGPLYEELRELLDADYPPTPLHRFFASLPAALRAKGYPTRHQLIVTTNYDDVLERAFQAAGEPYDLVAYVADGAQRGKFLHWKPDGTVILVEKPNEYLGFELDEDRSFVRPVVLKIHGAVDRANPDRDSYVITEDHYIDYLTHTDISNLVPTTLAEKLKRSHFLFLGYSLRDWNLRVILQRIWGEQRLNYNSWAIQRDPAELDRRFWLRRGVEIRDEDLDHYIDTLERHVQTLPPAPPADA